MRLTKTGTDYIEISEENLDTLKSPKNKVHIIKLNFEEPNEDKCNRVLSKFNKTNRFVIEDNIRFYNFYFKDTHKKYYVENTNKDNLITFFRRNNKILFNFCKAPEIVDDLFLFDYVFLDVLKNVEVIKVTRSQYNIIIDYLKKWNGNVIIE